MKDPLDKKTISGNVVDIVFCISHLNGDSSTESHVIIYLSVRTCIILFSYSIHIVCSIFIWKKNDDDVGGLGKEKKKFTIYWGSRRRNRTENVKPKIKLKNKFEEKLVQSANNDRYRYCT